MSWLLDQVALMLDRGGIVMIPLFALSVVAVALILERSWFWWRTHRRASRRRVDRMIELLAQGDGRAEALIMSDTTVYGAVARSLERAAGAVGGDGGSWGTGDAAAIAAVERVRPRIERFIGALSTIITAAPLMGIMGTVTGIIRSFNLLGAQERVQDLHGVSAGIAEALLNTALGLAVALVAVFPWMIFRGQADRALGRIEALVAAFREGAAKRANHAATETRRTEDRTRKGPARQPAGDPLIATERGDAPSPRELHA